MDTSSKLATLVMLVILPAPLLAQSGEGRGSRLSAIAAEMRTQIEEVSLAIAEQPAANPNLDEICFRVGNLYQTARHELAENLAEEPALPANARRLAEQLIQDGKALPSFCGDIEKARQDPGDEAVPRGDIPALRKELARIADQAGQFEGYLAATSGSP